MPKKSMRVYQIDCTSGEILAEYSSLNAAERITHISKSQISKCCRNIYSRACGYAWGTDLTLLDVIKSIKKDKKVKEKVSLIEALEILRKYHNTHTYKQIATKTGYTCEELRYLYDKYKIYRCEG